MIIIDSYYLTDESRIDETLDLLSISHEELEDLVGRFAKSHHKFPGALKGQVMVYEDGAKLVHHFHKKLIAKFDF